MKIAILGNSHVICLKQGWDRMRSDIDDVEVTFFASKGPGLSNLRCEAGALVATDEALIEDLRYSSGGTREIVAAAYDAFLVAGVGGRLPRIRTRFSSAVQAQCLRDWTDSSLNARICAMLRSLTPAPIYAMHAPAAAAGASRSDPEASLSHDDVFRQAALEFERIGARLLPQPASTLESNGFTKADYAVGSLRWSVFGAHPPQHFPDTDIAHMNADFGEIAMQAFFERLDIRMRMSASA